ncbi:MAG: hypothetical protein ABIF77_22105 [bacterium]
MDRARLIARLIMESQYPECKKCGEGLLLPLSDYGREGASIHFKAWVCHNPQCGFNIRIDNGEVSYSRVMYSTR